MDTLKKNHHTKVRTQLEAAHVQMAQDKEKALHNLTEQFQRAHEANLANLKRDIATVHGQIPPLAQDIAHMMMERLTGRTS